MKTKEALNRVNLVLNIFNYYKFIHVYVWKYVCVSHFLKTILSLVKYIFCLRIAAWLNQFSCLCSFFVNCYQFLAYPNPAFN